MDQVDLQLSKFPPLPPQQGFSGAVRQGLASRWGSALSGGRLTRPSSALSLPVAPMFAPCRSWLARTGNTSPTASSGTRGRSVERQRKYPNTDQGLPEGPTVEVGAGWEKQMVWQMWDVGVRGVALTCKFVMNCFSLFQKYLRFLSIVQTRR